MKKRCVSIVTPFINHSAFLIVAHGRWQKSRNRQPSMSYGSIHNPRIAFQHALRDVAKYEAYCGSHIPREIVNMSHVSRITKINIYSNFNSIKITAQIGSKSKKLSKELVDEWHRLCQEGRKRYLRSPQGRYDRWKLKQDVRTKRSILKHLLGIMSTQNYNDTDKLLWWLCEFEQVQHTALKKQLQNAVPRIVNVFVAHGYEISANTEDQFNANNTNNHARYIIGQALHCLDTTGTIHQILPDFVDE